MLQLNKILMCILIMSVIITIQKSISQQMDHDADQKGFTSLKQSGQLVTVELIPSEKEFTLKLVGTPAAALRWDRVTLQAIYGLGPVKQVITVSKKEGGEYTIKRDHFKSGPLEIRFSEGQKVEDFKFEVK